MAKPSEVGEVGVEGEGNRKRKILGDAWNCGEQLGNGSWIQTLGEADVCRKQLPLGPVPMLIA